MRDHWLVIPRTRLGGKARRAQIQTRARNSGVNSKLIEFEKVCLAPESWLQARIFEMAYPINFPIHIAPKLLYNAAHAMR